MKRKFSISTAMALVAVFAIIATLGLLSPNQATPVYAAVPGGSTVGTMEGPEVMLRFSAPTGGLVDEDSIIIRMPNFNVTAGSADDADSYEFSGITGVADTDITAEGTGDAATVTIAITDASTVTAGNSVSITILSAAGITAPDAEKYYTITVDIQKADVGISAVATETVHVQNSVRFEAAPIGDGTSVTASHAMVDEKDEDVPSGEIEVMFDLNPPDGGLSIDDNDTITIQLENFYIPTSLSASHIKIMAPNEAGDGSNDEPPASVSVSGDTVTLDVPDMDSRALQVQSIPAGTAGSETTVTVTFLEDAGIMNPMNGGMHSVKAHTSASSKPAEQMICFEDGASPPYTAITDQGGCTADDAEMIPLKVGINPTTPDITRVSLSDYVSGTATSMTVRFVTDANLDSEDTIMLKLGERVDEVYSGFVLPDSDFFPDESVSVNGTDIPDPDVDSDNGTALLNGWEVVLSWRDEANTASLQSAFQETHHHQEIPTSDT